jgi:hypothetical protein
VLSPTSSSIRRWPWMPIRGWRTGSAGLNDRKASSFHGETCTARLGQEYVDRRGFKAKMSRALDAALPSIRPRHRLAQPLGRHQHRLPARDRGIDQFSVISSGGLEFISSGGTVSGGTVIGGGRISVAARGSVLGGLTISGGAAVISGTVAAGQTRTQLRIAANRTSACCQ